MADFTIFTESPDRRSPSIVIYYSIFGLFMLREIALKPSGEVSTSGKYDDCQHVGNATRNQIIPLPKARRLGAGWAILFDLTRPERRNASGVEKQFLKIAAGFG